MPSTRSAPALFVDCHVHLDGFADEDVRGILSRARQAGVGAVVTAGTTVESSGRAVALARTFAEVLAGVGIHPFDVTGPVDEANYAALRDLALSTEKVVVISEIGLDFMEGAPNRATQYQVLREQVRLARELTLPIVFHSREAHDETLRVLREERAYEVGGAFHYFQGDEPTAQTAIDLGFHISLARPLLRLPRLQAVAARLPLERIVLETDSAPQPFKAKRENWTEPRHLAEVAAKLAELKRISVDEVRRATTGNALRMLGRKPGLVEAVLAPET
jgi:TatD DNase family protein